jgi:hypothetical protein
MHGIQAATLVICCGDTEEREMLIIVAPIMNVRYYVISNYLTNLRLCGGASTPRKSSQPPAFAGGRFFWR